MVAVDGWTGATDHEGQAFAESLVELGCRCVVFTDIDRDGIVGFTDVLAVLQAWGTCEGCPEDLDGNGVVDFADILLVLADWGACE